MVNGVLATEFAVLFIESDVVNCVCSLFSLLFFNLLVYQVAVLN